MTNNRRKGKDGELAAVKLLHSLGYTDARRTQQYNGLGLSDVVCPESLPDLAIEVKYGDKVQLGNQAWRDACEQAERDADGKPWIVLWKNSRQPWRLTYFDKMLGVYATICESEVGKFLKWESP